MSRGVKTAIGWAALGTGMLVTGAVALANRHIDQWETLSPEDAGDGDFITLSDGARMHHLACGQHGSSVLLVYGLMDSAKQWRQNIDVLAREHRVWAVDLVGFGFSARVTEPKYSLHYFARSLREFIDAQAIKRASIIGHSLGGAVALEFARTYPTQVDKLILIAPGTYLTNIPAWLKWMAQVPYVPRAVIGALMSSRRARMHAWRHAVGNPKNMNPQEYATRVRVARVKGTADALVAMMTSRWTNHLGERLAQVTAPTLILWGDRDRSVPPQHGIQHVCALPNAELVILESAGHIPQSEYPDVVNRLILEFLRNGKAHGRGVSRRVKSN